MNLFVVEQFYKIFKFHFIQDSSFNLIPHITFHLFTSSIFSNLGTIFISSSIQKRFFLCSINLRSIPIDLYKLGIIFNVSNEFGNLSCCTLFKSFYKDFREVNISFRVARYSEIESKIISLSWNIGLNFSGCSQKSFYIQIQFNKLYCRN